MEDINLTVKEVSDLKGCSERWVQRLIETNKINFITVDEQATGRGGIQYRIPITALEEKLQLKYKRKQKREAERENTELTTDIIEPSNFNIEQLSIEEREEIENWKKVLISWQDFRNRKTNKIQVDNDFINLINSQYPDLKLTIRTLQRRWKEYMEKGDLALLDKRGKHRNHNKKMSKEIWEIFEYYYLDESRKSSALCITLTKLSLEQKQRADLLPLPSTQTFLRHTSKIPAPYIEYFRYGRKSFLDKCSPYIKRIYTDLESNDIWVADNHTFDILVRKGDTPMRIHLTSFLDVRSRKMVGFCVTENPCADATVYALRRGIERYGIPKMIYTDNGREFLFHDFGGNGFRRKRKDAEAFKPPTILEKLQIEFRTALPQNGKAKIVERSYRTVKETFSKLFEAYTGGHILERPERLKYVVKKSENLIVASEFMEYVDKYLYGWYNKQPHNGEGMNGKTPDEVFAENLNEKRVATQEDLNLMLMRTTNPMKVKRNGVALTFYGQKLEYWTNELLLNHLGEKVYVRYSPENLEKVRIYDQKDIFICEAPLAEQLSYHASKEEIAKEQKEVRGYEKLIKAYKKQKNIQTEKAFDLIINKAIENMEEEEKINPKVLRVIRNNEVYPKAVGADEVYDEPIDWTEGLKRLKEIKDKEVSAE